MPVNVAWLDDTHTIVRVDYVPPNAWDDIHAAVGRVYALIDSRPHRVHVLHDFTFSPNLPDIHVYANLKKAVDHEPDNLGLTLVLGAAPMLQQVIRVSRDVFPDSRLVEGIRIVNSIEEARALAARYDGSGHADHAPKP